MGPALKGDFPKAFSADPLLCYTMAARYSSTFGRPGGIDLAQWGIRVKLIDANYDGIWELPVLGAFTAPAAVLIRPDGYVAWVGDLTQHGLAAALTTWFGPAAAA